MHEMSIAQSLIDIITEEMLKHEASSLKSVRLHVGQMSGIVPDALSFGFEVLTSDTKLAGAELIIEVIPLTGRCLDCKRKFDIEDYAFECPHCGSPNIKTISGQDLSIQEIDVD